MTLPCSPVQIIRFDTSDALNGYRIPGGPWQAIAIGPESEVDRCVIVADGAGAPIQTAGGLTNSIDRQVDISDHAFAVSVERPWIGPIGGPLNVLLPYAHTIYNASRLRSDAQRLWQTFSGRPTYTARVELLLFPFMPPWLPSKRTPLDFAFNYPEFGTTGETSVTLYLPGFGRKSLSLSLDMGGRSAGSLNWRFQGRNVVETGAASAVVINDHDLQALTTESADFDRTYFFDGEFDLYILTLTENAALNAGVEVKGIFKAWD